MPTWDDVVQIGLSFPEVEQSTWFRRPALKVGGKGMCNLRTDPDALVIRVTDMLEREAMLQGNPDVFFTTPHYDGYPYVLVKLDKVDPGELRELVEEAWRIFAPKRLVKAYDADSAGVGRCRELGAQSRAEAAAPVARVAFGRGAGRLLTRS